MPSAELERLAKTGLLHAEAMVRQEFEGLLLEATATLKDAKNTALASATAYAAEYATARRELPLLLGRQSHSA